MKKSAINCAKCPYKPVDRLCRNENGKAPDFCPTRDRTELRDKSINEYTENPDIFTFAQQASLQESSGYANRELGYEHLRATKSRLEEIADFAARMNYTRLGLAFCLGLRNEAKTVEQLYSSKGFEIVSAVCKAGRTDKQQIGLKKEDQLDPESSEAMCNPIFQAMLLNEEKTQFNILLGLCVGHDSLFFRYAEAPCTVLAVKDRLLGHNPLAAVYNIDSYYRCLK
jgi:uncharacterized metal-binding protein